MKKEYKFNLIPKEVIKISTKHRKICTKIPVPESLETINRSMKYEPWSMNHQLPVVWDKAIDYNVFDAHGNKWIDFSSGIFVTNTGHGNKSMIDALKEIIDKPLLNNYYYHSDVRSLLAEQLIKMAPKNMDKVFFLTTGSETTECAMKISRIRGQKKNKDKIGIIAFTGGFHGKTKGAQTLSGKDEAKKWMGNIDSAVYHLPYPTNAMEMMDEQNDEKYGEMLFEKDIENLKNSGVDLDTIAGIIFEPYQGWGALFFPKAYVQAMKKFAEKVDALLISDEVQSGFGRTGKLFGFEHYDVDVDVICCGKAISGALPLSAVLSRSEVIDIDSSLNSTHGGSPLPCASALANLKYLEENDLVNEAKRKGELIKNELLKWKNKYKDRIKAIHGKGMVYAVIIVKPGTEDLDIEFVDKVIERAFEKGLISIRTMTGTIKLGAPLTIPDEALIEGLNIIEESINEIIIEG